MGDIRPNRAEVSFLTLAYNRLYDIRDEVLSDDFWLRDPFYRLSLLKDGFAVYSELLKYEPLKWIIDEIKLRRPPMEAEIASELFKFIRNVLFHFPFYRSWDDVYITHSLVNWHKDGLSIDKFLLKFLDHPPVKYRFWQENKKTMTYLSITFPSQYADDNKIFLRDILSEKEGVKFSLILMCKIADTQVEG